MRREEKALIIESLTEKFANIPYFYITGGDPILHSRVLELMENYPDGKASIQIREQIVLPLLTIQQYALIKINEIRKGTTKPDLLEVYEKLVTRSLFGNINASRNSA